MTPMGRTEGNRTRSPKRWTIVLAAAALLALAAAPAFAIPQINLQVGDDGDPSGLPMTLKIVLFMTVLSLAPAFAVLVTSFTRIVVVFSFLKHAIGQQQMPPNQIIIGLALFLTVFIMAPVWQQVNETAIQPLSAGEIEEGEAWNRAMKPVREFMFHHTREKDLGLFLGIAGLGPVETRDEVPTHIVVPAFVVSELTTAFQIGFLLFIPFLVIDMVVASVLMSMGMMMLPPIMISMPFKILLFVMVDGWYLIVQSLVTSFG
ncbi:MAG: flagellar type III secretion system pore protein FliP [Candidatus Eisenbacteria bacterium]